MGGAQLFAAPTEKGTEFKLENRRPTPVLLEQDMLRLHASGDTSPRRATKKQLWTGRQPVLPSIIPTSVSSQGSRPDRLARLEPGFTFFGAPRSGKPACKSRIFSLAPQNPPRAHSEQRLTATRPEAKPAHPPNPSTPSCSDRIVPSQPSHG